MDTHTNTDAQTATEPMRHRHLVAFPVFAFLLTGNHSSGKAAVRILDLTNPTTPLDVGAAFVLPDSGDPVGFDCEGEYFYIVSNPLSGTNSNHSSLSVLFAP